MPAPFITMISESVASLLQDVRHRDHQRDRRDHHDQQWNDQAGDADEDQDGLALAGHEVDVAHRLGEPDRHGQADKHHQKRTQAWCEKCIGRSTPSACVVPTFGRTNPRAGHLVRQPRPGGPISP